MLLAVLDNWERWVTLAVVILVAYLIVVWIAAVYWTYRDSGSRNRDPVVQTLCMALVAVFNLPGLLLYLILRPKLTLAERYDRQLEAEALLHEIREQPACPACRRRIESEFIACPYCKAALRDPCNACGRALAFGWVVCAYCGAERQNPAEQSPPLATPATVPARAMEPPMTRPERPRRASTARYTPPAKPSPAGAPSTDPAPDATP